MAKERTDLILPAQFQRVFGVSRRTAKRWSSSGTKPQTIALARLVIAGDLGAVAAPWRGWIIRQDRLYDPLGSAMRGWTPEHVRALEYLHDLVRAQQREIAKLRDPEREPRQLTTLSRPAQSTERRLKDRRATPAFVAPFAFSAPARGRITPASGEGHVISAFLMRFRNSDELPTSAELAAHRLREFLEARPGFVDGFELAAFCQRQHVIGLQRQAAAHACSARPRCRGIEAFKLNP